MKLAFYALYCMSKKEFLLSTLSYSSVLYCTSSVLSCFSISNLLLKGATNCLPTCMCICQSLLYSGLRCRCLISDLYFAHIYKSCLHTCFLPYSCLVSLFSTILFIRTYKKGASGLVSLLLGASACQSV